VRTQVFIKPHVAVINNKLIYSPALIGNSSLNEECKGNKGRGKRNLRRCFWETRIRINQRVPWWMNVHGTFGGTTPRQTPQARWMKVSWRWQHHPFLSL